MLAEHRQRRFSSGIAVKPCIRYAHLKGRELSEELAPCQGLSRDVLWVSFNSPVFFKPQEQLELSRCGAAGGKCPRFLPVPLQRESGACVHEEGREG